MTQLSFPLAVTIFVVLLLSISVFFLQRARRVRRSTWPALLGRLKRIDRDKFAAVALDLLEESPPQAELDPGLIFDMVGGLEGLSALEQNCDVLIDLATYVQTWYPEALELAEELRLNAREVQWHIGRLRGASRTGHLRAQFPIYAQRAVATYYLMTRSLLILYEGMEVPGFAELQRTI